MLLKGGVRLGVRAIGSSKLEFVSNSSFFLRASHTMDSLKVLNEQMKKNSFDWSQKIGCAL